MVEKPAAVTRAIERFRLAVEQMGVHCEKVYLFGSYAKGISQEGSDIDLIVVSSDWSRLGRRERLELLGVAAARVLEPIQAQAPRSGSPVGSRRFTPEEVRLHQLGTFWEAMLSKEAVAIT